MNTLPLRPLPKSGEALSDFIARLAFANGYQAYELWNVLNKGIGAHESVLSQALNGLALPEFSGPICSGIEIPVNSFGLKSSDFTHLYRRWCPLCVELEPWLRPAWRLKISIACASHGVHLLERCPRCHNSPNVGEIMHGVCECGVVFKKVLSRAPKKQVELMWALQASLLDKAVLPLDGESATLTTQQLVRLIFYTGRFIDGPTLSKPGKIRDLESLSVALNLVTGVSILLKGWPGVFWDCLQKYVDNSPGDMSVQRVFSPLYHVIYKDLREPAFQFLRDAFELFLLDHWRGELCGRHRLFSEVTVSGSRHQGLAHIARATGRGRETLKRLVHQDWLPANRFSRSEKREVITIDRTKLADFIPDASHFLDLRSVSRLLGIKRTRLRELVAVGIILADMAPRWSTRSHWHFRRSEIDRFLLEIRQLANSYTGVIGSVTLRHAFQYWHLKTHELKDLLQAVKEKRIFISLSEHGQFCDVAFEEKKLHDWLSQHRQSTAEWISATTAAKMIGLKEQVVYELIAKNLISADIESRDGRIFKRISSTSLERFRREYVSLAELAIQENLSPNTLLKKLNVVPVSGPKIDGGRQYFYRRADLESS
ncbi:hypothetical protein [Herbaspirillum lusitanum]|uniref:hypothetical protein n=1 Tax=Herbaspirillum lusitanum TaxID=213312 RepID=UPI0002F7ED30|nr:hypothetical protein [Herbaspirillum lusitanum]